MHASFGDGSVVIVTGAARGLGAAVAQHLAAHAVQVVATDLDDSASEALDRPGIAYRRLDVTDEASWHALAAWLVDTFGELPVKGLVSNAGTTHRARVGEIAVADWQRVLDVNLTGSLRGIQTMSALMTAGSSIVCIGSSAALMGHYPAAYTASKWGLRGLVHAAATELGPRGIRVNVVHPGFIETEMTASAPPTMREAQLELTPLERVGSPADVASVVAFLLSDDAAYVTGAEAPVDGGFTSPAGAKLLSDRIAGRRPSAATPGD
ncbi:SDR family oxidoreductase [Microbacterium sp. SSW1-49]|uniref:SDR family oxidoreductase n=1 Tax=Microbacterium croceum TaxID=2851645 RepID=A0ABT0FC67_9MICO|nr:SDR family NAD(P)-dependent oxidoreductase [Microbacterium croceum]MCK2035652.1 SDR family oxidoreductase [Microbacterium croceum]